MGAFKEAVKTRRVSKSDNGKTTEYQASIDTEWSVAGVPHGGYQASVLLSALAQQDSPHKDPAHLMITYYRPALPGEMRILITTVSASKGWSNYDIKTYQKDQLVVSASAIYTNMPPFPSTDAPFSTTNQNLLPYTKSAFAPVSPFLTHPSKTSSKPVSNEHSRRWSSNSVFWFVPNGLKWAEDLAIRERREKAAKEHKEGNAKLDWAAWLEFRNEGDVASDTVSWGFWSDMMSSIPEIFPPGELVDPHYYPTLAMSLHFHAKLPLGDPYLVAPTTVGCYSYGKHIHNGRHEQIVEVWTAPSAIEDSSVNEADQQDWRRRSMLLLTSTQLALSVPISKMKKPAPGAKRPDPKL